METFFIAYNLCFPPGLYDGLPSAISHHGFDIIGKTRCEAYQSKEPEDQTNWQGYLSLDSRRLIFKMEGYHNGNGNDRHIYGEPQPGQKRCKGQWTLEGVLWKSDFSHWHSDLEHQRRYFQRAKGRR